MQYTGLWWRLCCQDEVKKYSALPSEVGESDPILTPLHPLPDVRLGCTSSYRLHLTMMFTRAKMASGLPSSSVQAGWHRQVGLGCPR